MKWSNKINVLYATVFLGLVGFVGLVFADTVPLNATSNLLMNKPVLNTVNSHKTDFGKIPKLNKGKKKYQTHGVVFFDLSQKQKTVSPNTPHRLADAGVFLDRSLVTKSIDISKLQVTQLAKFSDAFKKEQSNWLKGFTKIKQLPQPQGNRRLLSRISVPDIMVEVRKPDYKTVLASALTDLHGHYRIPALPVGRYALCWKGSGWKEECFSQLISIQKNTFYSDIIYIRPAMQTDRVAPLTGKVKMLDGKLCRHLDIHNSVNITASVQLNHEKTPLTTVRANSMGQYVFPVASRNGKVSVAAHCPGVSVNDIDISLKSQHKVIKGGQMLVTGDRNTFSGVKAASSKVVLSQQYRQDLILLGKNPNIVGFGVKAAGSYITKARVGEKVQLTSPILGGGFAKHVRFWRVSGGQLSTTTKDHTVMWQLPQKAGQYVAEVSVVNKRGGWSAKKLVFQVGDDLRLSFSGTVRVGNGVGGGSVGAIVKVSGQSLPVNSNGYFRGLVEPNKDNRYTLSIKADGYMPFSQVYHRATSGGTYILEPVESRTFDAKKGAMVSFGIPNFKKRLKKCRKEARKTDKRCNFETNASIALKPGSLVDQNGQVYNGQVVAQGAYLDPSLSALPGDYDGLSQNAQNQSLISYGAMYVSFKDASGKKLQLGKDQFADIAIPIPADRNISKSPQTIPLWYYNYDTGYWEEEAQGHLHPQGRMYHAKVKHFSTINMDVGTVGNAVCARVEVDFLNTPEDRVLQVTTTLPGGGTQVKQSIMDDTLNAVYRLLPNETVTFNLLRSDGSDYPEAVYKDEAGVVIPGGQISLNNSDLMVGVDLWPESPFEDCVPYILLTGEIEPAFTFLTRKNANDTDEIDTDGDGVEDTPEGQLAAEAYYELMDPNDDRTTLQSWLEHNGFSPTVSGSGFEFPLAAQVVELSYLNHGDLGSGRRMHCRKDTQRVACVVGNYAAADDIDNAFNRDPAAAEVAFNANMGEGFATVAMEFSETEGIGSLAGFGHANSTLVKFFTYADVDSDGVDERVTAAGLDRVSDPAARWQPNVCMICHGGEFPTNIFPSGAFPLSPSDLATANNAGKPLGAAVIENASQDHRDAMVASFMDSPSAFREFDLDAIINLQGTLPESKAKQLNCNYVQATLPPDSEIQDILDGWYGVNCTEAGSPVQNTYIPSTWAAANNNTTAYTEVAGKVCRTCHIAQQGLEVTVEGSYPWTTMSTPNSETFACNSDMPQAAVTHNAYWMENLEQILINQYGVTACSP